MVEGPGPLIIDIAGTVLEAEDREVLSHPLVGGMILFTRNFESPSQLAGLIQSVRALPGGDRLLVTVDHEGGRVQRFREGFTVLPAAAIHGERAVADLEGACEGAGTHAETLARELRAVGVDLSFAPVLDIGRGLGSVIGNRALATEAGTVLQLGRAWRVGMRRGGMAACGKHFPGHGGVSGDSHHELPMDARPLEVIEREDLVPFHALIEEGLESVMMAHVLYPQIDDRPASVSTFWIRAVLRKRFRFPGVVFCDDLTMAGLAGLGDCIARARAALEAGCDALPVCNDRTAVISLLDTLPAHLRAPGLTGLRA